MFVKHVNNFLEFFEKSLDFEKNEAQNLAGILCKNLIFGLKFFLQRFLENVLWPLRVCSRYLNDTVSLDFSSIKHRDHKTQQSNRMLGKVKKPKYQILTCTYQVNNLSFWKNETQNQVGIFWQKVFFWAKLLVRWL